MKKTLLSLGLLVSSFTFAQTACCDVIDTAGITVITQNGNCVVTANAEEDCTKTITPAPAKAETLLTEEESAILIGALEGVKFKTNSDVLLEESYDKLDAVAEVLNHHPELNLIIDGYTDNTGASEYNHSLSLKRANAAKNRLVTVDKVSADRITTHGYGEESPVASNDTPEGRAANRRIEFKVSF